MGTASACRCSRNDDGAQSVCWCNRSDSGNKNALRSHHDAMKPAAKQRIAADRLNRCVFKCPGMARLPLNAGSLGGAVWKGNDQFNSGKDKNARLMVALPLPEALNRPALGGAVTQAGR